MENRSPWFPFRSRGRSVLTKTLSFAAVWLLTASPAFGQRAKSPADAAVFIRIVGSVHADIDEFGVRRTVDLDRVEIGTGSGFVISPYGYVITNDHVVNDTEPILITRIKGFQEAKITFKTSRIDVCFQAEAVAAHGLAAPCFAATVAASDPAIDLAALFISGSNLPYVALGDSDAVATGLAVDALGYPLGRDVEVGRTNTVSDVVPNVSATPGAVSALRANDAGERRYLQITNSVNPGNSGGPVVDRDGFAVGVVRMRLTRAAGIGFAIPINEVKDFLESRGLDQAMPSRRLRLGPLQTLEGKGLTLRLPETLADTSPFQSHVETAGDTGELALRIDRVLSPWRPQQLEEALLGGQTFEPLAMTQREGRAAARDGLPGALFGSATATGQDSRIDYLIIDLGAEKLVARYAGSSERIAFNESVLHQSLASVQAQRFVPDESIAIDRLQWSTINGRSIVPVPTGWSVEPGRPSPCPGLPQPTSFSAAFPSHDFTVVLRAAAWADGEVVPETAAAACSSRRGNSPGAYASRGEWLGTSYVIEGVFVRVGAKQVVQLEILATQPRAALARALLEAWVKKVAE